MEIGEAAYYYYYLSIKYLRERERRGLPRPSTSHRTSHRKKSWEVQGAKRSSCNIVPRRTLTTHSPAPLPAPHLRPNRALLDRQAVRALARAPFLQTGTPGTECRRQEPSRVARSRLRRPSRSTGGAPCSRGRFRGHRCPDCQPCWSVRTVSALPGQ